jgi:hypothetical protein
MHLTRWGDAHRVQRIVAIEQEHKGTGEPLTRKLLLERVATRKINRGHKVAHCAHLGFGATPLVTNSNGRVQIGNGENKHNYSLY